VNRDITNPSWKGKVEKGEKKEEGNILVFLESNVREVWEFYVASGKKEKGDCSSYNWRGGGKGEKENDRPPVWGEREGGIRA